MRANGIVQLALRHLLLHLLAEVVVLSLAEGTIVLLECVVLIVAVGLLWNGLLPVGLTMHLPLKIGITGHRVPLRLVKWLLEGL